MADLNVCEHCGSAVSPADLTVGHCPMCMVDLGFEPSSTNTDFGAVRTAESMNGAAVIGGYTILNLIGEGGMGAVYEAEQHQPRRIVAVKIIKAGRANADLLRRFGQEAQALGRLQHPNIARIYEAGTADTGFGPQPYFAMEFIRGLSPLDYANAQHLQTRDRLELVARIADGVHHAHQHGLIHRDLKPANILVDEDGQPRILDFGVARISDSAELGQTDAGQLVGTLAYMSPEQVSGDPLEIDIRTDVYALGVILYELLAGRRPYDIGRTLRDAMRTIREIEPEPLGAIDRAWRGDVETIAARALEKDKSRRYGSAADLAADIRRHLRHEPIIARPPSTTYQLQKFARRHRAIVIGVAATILALVAGVIVSARQTARAQRAERGAIVERDRARDAERLATLERNRAEIAEAGAGTQRDLAQRAEEVALADRNRAIGAEDRARHDRDTLLWQTLARESVRYSDSRLDDDRAALLARQAQLVHARTPDVPALEIEDALQRATRQGPWGHTLFRGTSAVLSVAISRDDYLACACGDAVVRVWDLRDPGAAPLQLAGHKNGVEAIAFAEDGRRLAAGDRSGVVLVWDLGNPRAEPVQLNHAGGAIHGVAFSPDARRLAASNGGLAVHVWDLRNPGLAPTVLRHADSAQALAFSPDGTRLASSGFGLQLWDLNTPAAAPVRLRGVETLVSGVAFAPDGVRIASAENSGVYVWDVSLPAAPAITLADPRSGAIAAVAFSADGSQLAAGGFRTLTVWDTSKPAAPSLRFDGYEGQVMAAAFSRDGRYLATGASDKTLRVWDLKQDDTPMVLSPGPLVPTSRYTTRLTGASFPGLAFSRDGARLAAGSDDPNVRVWNLNQIDAAPLVLRGHEDAVLTVAFSADGSRLASGGSTTTPESQLGLYTPEGKRLASGGDGILRVWNLSTPNVPPLKFSGHRDAILALLFSPQGWRLSSASADGSVRSWDAGDPRRSSLLLDERSQALAVATEPYKRRLLNLLAPMGRDGDDAILLARAIQSVDKGQSSFFTVAFSPDLTQLATVGADRRTVRVWDLTNRDALPRLLDSRSGSIAAIAFAPDGRHLAIGGTNPNVQVWDVANPANPPVSQGQENILVSAVAFSPDSSRVAYPAGRANERGVHIWDWRKPAKPPVRLPGPPPPGYDALAFSPDGRQLAALHRGTGRIALWRLTSGAADYLCARVWRNLTAEEWGSYVGSNVPYESTCPAVPGGVHSVNRINVGRIPAGAQAQPLAPAAADATGTSRDFGPGCAFSGLRIEGTRLTITAPLSMLISLAYGSRDHDCRVPGAVVGGPEWIRSERHEIHVTLPEGLPPDTQLRVASRAAPPMVQAVLKTVLEERFKLLVRSETRDIPAYALTSSGQPSLTPSTRDDIGLRSARTLVRRLDPDDRPYGDLTAGQASMADLANLFKGIVGAPVEDRTGVTGRFYIELEFDQSGLARPTISAALQRIGLDLKAANVPMQVLIVERAERPGGR